MTTSLQEAFGSMATQFINVLGNFRKSVINKLKIMRIASEIDGKKERLSHIENTLLPVTKKSVSRKKLLQEQKQLQTSIQELQGDYHRLRNQAKRDKPIDPDEIDTAFMNLKGWRK